ncbi:hypothetical protein [Halobacillus yeomjeoni]|uniref:Phospholipase D-like domain-containing protein n=1 Tax=Halobacillus yeomjeoni TaxID=311194 RepID=A0A931HS06_9BACI|nr:hypothetical protein [Halobacillus yeomjeoni]MBH0228842.1 hypothetical protein [Halobacillus yeomjeoni]
MGIAILFRKDLNKSPFRIALDYVVSLSGEGLILSSGYCSIKHQGFVDKVNEGFNYHSESFLKTLSGNFDIEGNEGKKHLEAYKNFARSLSRCNSKYKDFHLDKKGLWHAKFSIKVRDNSPVAMIIGSSNLSKSAYFCQSYPKHESDILIWDKRENEPSFISELPEGAVWILSPHYPGQENDLMRSQYDQFNNHIKYNENISNLNYLE